MLSVMSYALGWLLVSPVVAPVPAPPPPDPLARGYLGITVQANALAIRSVEPNTPASRAGLRPGDLIVRVGSLQPQAFEQVVAQITGYRPGAVVEIEVARGTEKKVFKVKLAVRDPAIDSGRLPGNPNPFPDD